MAPSPLNENDEVSSWSFVGNRNTSEHRLFVTFWPKSKLKIDDMVDVIVPLKDVPGALEGAELSMGMIR